MIPFENVPPVGTHVVLGDVSERSDTLWFSGSKRHRETLLGKKTKFVTAADGLRGVVVGHNKYDDRFVLVAVESDDVEGMAYGLISRDPHDKELAKRLARVTAGGGGGNFWYIHYRSLLQEDFKSVVDLENGWE